MWKYESPIGTMYIRRLPNGRYGLIYDGIIWETCDTPQAEADNVFMQCTGCTDWDLFNSLGYYIPRDIWDWEEC